MATFDSETSFWEFHLAGDSTDPVLRQLIFVKSPSERIPLPPDLQEDLRDGGLGLRAFCIAILMAKAKFGSKNLLGKAEIASSTANETWIKTLANSLKASQQDPPRWVECLKKDFFLRKCNYNFPIDGRQGRKTKGPDCPRIFYLANVLSVDRLKIFRLDGQTLHEIAGDALVEFARQLETGNWKNEVLLDTLSANHSVSVSPSIDSSTKHIVLISPGLNRPFYREVLEMMAISARRALDRKCVLVPFMPQHNFDSLELWSMVESLRTKAIKAHGAILIPDYPDDNFDAIAGLMNSRNDIPIILFDVFFGKERLRDLDKEAVPFFVGCDELAGGRIASSIATDYLRSSNCTGDIRILVLVGADTTWEAGRLDGFREGVRTQFSKAQFMESHPLRYGRAGAYDFCLAEFNASSTKEINFDLAYACSDCMAIGARSAVIQAKARGFSFKPHFRIIGYDGIDEMKWFLRDHDPLLLGTVNVHIELQTSLCIETMAALLSGCPSSQYFKNWRRAGIESRFDGRVRLVKPTSLLPHRGLEPLQP